MKKRDNDGRLFIHLDPLGGIAGDMFVAALLDAFPELEDAVYTSIIKLGLGPDSECWLERHNDGTLVGSRFIVGTHVGASPPRHNPANSHSHGKVIDADNRSDVRELPADRGCHVRPDRRHAHTHRAWRDIRELLKNAALTGAVKQHALAIFQLLAQTEARVHGVAEEEVTFHEVGATDSICDIVAASVLIASIDAGWTIAPLPLGGGRVQTQHGPLPVPAPATALLLRGFETIQDGFSGERVTPTGAAIVRHLCHRQTISAPCVLERTGIGFGLRRIPGLSNCVRVLVSRELAQSDTRFARKIAIVEFDIDDQSPEELSVGLDRIRSLDGIHDVVQFSGIGKKSRSFVHVRILAAPDMLERTIDACFAETTTIGLRYHMVNGIALARIMDSIEIGGRLIRVKSVERTGGRWTAKADIDDVASEGTEFERIRLRRSAEKVVLDSREMGDAKVGLGEGGGSED